MGIFKVQMKAAHFTVLNAPWNNLSLLKVGGAGFKPAPPKAFDNSRNSKRVTL